MAENDYGDKELEFKIFKLRLAYLSNKEENQIVVNNIEKNKDKLFKQNEFYNFVIQPNDRRIDLTDAVNLILDFNETIQLNLT